LYVNVRYSARGRHPSASQPAPVRVSVDRIGERPVEVSMPTLYTLLDSDRYGEHLLEFECAPQGVSLFSATFG
jgi:Thioredoxin like C-terminal domain